MIYYNIVYGNYISISFLLLYADGGAAAAKAGAVKLDVERSRRG